MRGSASCIDHMPMNGRDFETRPRSPLAVVILALVDEEPMHPYRMQQLITFRGKDKIVNVAQRNSVYQTIERLLRDGLIAVYATDRAARRPARTVYTRTPLGRQTLERWLETMLSTPAREFPDFPAALAFLPFLTPANVRDRLEERAATLERRLAEPDELPPDRELPRIFLVEEEYQRAMQRAELEWVRSLIDDLAEHRLTWDEQQIRAEYGGANYGPKPDSLQIGEKD
jgi:DNA-binding PadR family transcriptional regulator